MRRIAVLSGLLLCLAVAVRAQSPEQIFEQANALYQQGKAAEAAETYESIVRNGYVSGDLYYNLGNAYYRAGNIARAILNYERAARLIPADEDLRHNLQLANLMIVDRIEPAPRLFIWDWWDVLKNSFSLAGVMWTTYTVLVIVFASIALFVVGRSYAVRKTALWTAAVSTVPLILLIIIFAARVSDIQRKDEAVVLAGVVTVKNSPDIRSSDAFVIHSGIKVRIVDRIDTWIKVRLADGKVGWMESASAETI